MLETQGDTAASPVELIDTADIPGGGQLRLLRRGEDFSIRFGPEELMGNQCRISEEALATMAWERLGVSQDTMLIGGLGMGFTLGAALAASPKNAKIVVSELVPKVLTWAQGELSHLFGDYLTDPRVSIEIADVHNVIVQSTERFDAILLDVDNGPDGLIQLANDRLYCNWGLRATYKALRPGGVLGVWSAYVDPPFVERLEAAGFVVDEVGIDVSDIDEEFWHTLWFATKPR